MDASEVMADVTGSNMLGPVDVLPRASLGRCWVCGRGDGHIYSSPCGAHVCEHHVGRSRLAATGPMEFSGGGPVEDGAPPQEVKVEAKLEHAVLIGDTTAVEGVSREDLGTSIPPGYFVVPPDLLVPSQALVEDAVRTLLRHIGEDPDRDGLLDTPGRVARALSEMTAGYRDDPAAILTRQFDKPHDELILLRGVPFSSLCEHHMLVFSGTADVAYIPDGGKVVGISKLARLVHCFARRLQVQERLAEQVADSIMEHLKPVGAACLIRAEHSCMSCRGVRVSGTELVTCVVRGVFRSDAAARAEFMALVGR